MLTENGFTFKKVILAVGKSDLRKGIDGLAAMVRLKYRLDPLEKDTLFLFCGIRCDRIKGLLWTGDRFLLLYVYESESYWDKEKKQPRSRRKLIGKLNEETGEIIPTGKSGRKGCG